MRGEPTQIFSRKLCGGGYNLIQNLKLQNKNRDLSRFLFLSARATFTVGKSTIFMSDLISVVAADGEFDRRGVAFETFGPGFHESGHRSPETIRDYGSTRRFRGDVPSLVPVPPPDPQIHLEL